MTVAAILTYHPVRIHENTYEGNDLIALDGDLRLVERLGYEVRSLYQLIAPIESGRLLNEIEKPVVAITLDDGSVFDFEDRMHPTCGPQQSAASILSGLRRELGCLAGASPVASTFVIASPSARDELDRADYFGGGYWPDNWWTAAATGGTLSVESHSWDHNHPSLARSVQRDNIRGTFRNIETEEEARAEVDQSLDYIWRTSGVRPGFFAYPWGEASRFLSEEYLPANARRLGLRAALSGTETSSGYVTQESNRWLVPRFVSGHDWKSTAGLERLLAPMALHVRD